MKRLFYVMVVLCLCLLGGCVDYREDLTLNLDGSGTLSFRIGINESMLYMLDGSGNGDFEGDEIREKFNKTPGLTAIDHKSYLDNGIRWMEFKLAFEELEVLAEVDKAFDESGFIGVISIESDEDGNLLFTRAISIEEPDEYSKEMLAEILSEFHWEYTTQFPGKVINANAAEENINKETNTVKWSFNMASLLYRPQIMSATIVKPRPRTSIWFYVFASICILVVLLLIVALLIKKHRKKTTIEN